jgi:outer membrane protein assembly factor BamB
VFHQNDKDVVAAATRDGRIVILDAASLGGANHATPLASRPFTAGAAVPDALAVWQEAVPVPAGAPASLSPIVTSWLLVPSAGTAAGTQAIASLKVTGDSSKISIEPAWTSRALVAPATPIIVNGIVFALSTGRAGAAGAAGTPGVLYALDGATGKELWSSGRTITANVPSRSFWMANDQALVATLDGALYAFGFAMERK